MSYSELRNCLACNGAQLYKYLGLGIQAPANTYPKEYSVLKSLRKYPLEVLFCKNCAHSQLSIAVDPEELFKDYLYVSGTTSTLKAHFKSLVTSALPIKPLGEISVLDIGANDYSLCREFQSRGVKVEGIDPAETLEHLAGNIPHVVDFWSSKAAYKVSGAPYDLITGLNVFAHNLDPYDFLLGCRRVLKPDGKVLLEYPACYETLRTADFSQCYHEHINYFTVSSMSYLCERAGFRIADIQEFPEIHGGTVRMILEVGLGAHCRKAGKMISKEWQEGLLDLPYYEDFKARVQKNIKDLTTLLRPGYTKTNKVIAYGASAKFSTLLGASTIGPAISYVVDDNPLKVGRFVTDSGIKIEPVDKLKEETAPLLILITPHNFRLEIKERLQKMGIRANLVVWVPEVQTEEI